MKNKIGIIAGEDIDMPADFLKVNKITVYNYNLMWEEIGNERKNLYSNMRKYKGSLEFGVPHTSQPSVGVFKDLYNSALKENETIFVVAISSKLSGSYNAAVQAVELLDSKDRKRVTVLDSYTISCGTALIIRELVKNVKAGVPFSELENKIATILNDINVIAMIEDTYWLQKGGRLSPAIGMIINQMKKINIRPLLSVKDGKIALLKVRTNTKNKVSGIWDYLEREVGLKSIDIIITHSDNAEEAEALRKKIEKKQKWELQYINELSPVLGAHVGPDSLIVGWKTKE